MNSIDKIYFSYILGAAWIHADFYKGESIMESIFFTVADLCQRYTIKQSTLYEWIRSRSLPKPVKFGRLSRWRASDIEQWEDGQPQQINLAPEARVAAVKAEMKRRNSKKTAVPVTEKLNAANKLKLVWQGKTFVTKRPSAIKLKLKRYSA